jgi:branched-chain amino acid transport system substrate-binding protein
MEKKKWLIFAATVICLAELRISPSHLQAQETLKIGMVAPFSGPGAPWGAVWKRTAMLEQEKINAAGGLQVGEKRTKVEFIYEDDKYSGAGGRMAAEKLIFKDKVKFIVGPISSASRQAWQEISKTNNIVVCGNTYTRSVMGPDHPDFFRPSVTGVEQAPCYYKIISERYSQIRKVAIVNRSDVTGTDSVKDSRRAARYLGFRILTEDFYEPGTKDFYPLLTRVLAKMPDIIDFGSSSAGDIFLMVKQARELGYTGRTLSLALIPVKEFCAVAGKRSAEGHIYNVMAPPFMTPAALEYQKEYVKRFGEWDEYAPKARTYTNALIRGIIKAKSIDPLEVGKTMAGMEWEELDGSYKFTCRWTYGIPHQGLSPFYFTEVRNGENVCLEVKDVRWVEALTKKFEEEALLEK